MRKIPQYEPYLGKEELVQLTNCIETNWITGGPKVKEFESRMAKLTGAKHAIACCNGTMALYLGLKLLGIGKGDKVIVPDFTFIASVNSVVMASAEPVFCDIDKESFCINGKTPRSTYTNTVKAIMSIGIYGNSPNMDEISAMTLSHDLKMIEDAAQDIAVTWDGKHLGTFGEVGCMSFYADKTISCLPPETRILTTLYKDGNGGSRTRLIQDIKVGNSVVSYNTKSGIKELDTVTKVFENEVNELLVIKLSNKNELQITENHPIYVVDKGWVKASEVKKGDTVLQYIYYGLGLRINGLSEQGMKLEDRWDKKRVKKWRNKHIKRLKQLHANPDSKYNSVDLKARGKKISIANKHFFKTREGILFKKKQSISMKRKYRDPNHVFNTKAFHKRRIEASTIANQNPESREKKSMAGKKNWQNKEYRNTVIERSNAVRGTKEYLENYARGLNLKPNKAELKLDKIIQDCCPNEFVYNGDYKTGISIGHYIPDFVNVNGKKKVIELFGRYWHDAKEIRTRKKKMKLLGWDCLIIWDDEIRNIDKVKSKVKTFVYNPKVKLVKVKSIKKIERLTKVYNIQTKKNHNYFAYGILVHNCGEGGMIFTDNDKFAEQAIRLLNQGRLTRGQYIHETIGFNFRLTDIQAAIGLAQLDKLDKIVKLKKYHESLYRIYLNGIECIQFPVIDSNCFNVPFRHNILVPDPEALSNYLTENGIGNLRFFYPLHRQPCYKYLGYNDNQFPNTVEAYNHGLSLPSSAKLTDDDIEYVCSKIRKFYR